MRLHLCLADNTYKPTPAVKRTGCRVRRALTPTTAAHTAETGPARSRRKRIEALEVAITEMIYESSPTLPFADVAALMQLSRKRFQGFLNHSSIVAWMKDEEGRFVYVNPTFQQVTGISLCEAVGRTDFDLFPEDEARAHREIDRRTLATRRPQEYTTRISSRRSRNHVWSVVKFPYVNPAGESFVGAVALDVTEKQEKLDALALEESRFKSAFQSAADFMLLLNTDGIVLDVNRTVLEFTAMDAGDFVGMPFREVFQRLPVQETSRRVEDAIAMPVGDTTVEFEIRIRRVGSTVVTIEFSLKAVCSEDGRRAYVLAAGRDITAKRQMEEKTRSGLEDRIHAQQQRLADLEAELRKAHEQSAVQAGGADSPPAP